MTDYDEPIEELRHLPAIVHWRLRAAGVKTIRQAETWLKNPHGSALTPRQLDQVRRSIELWDNGIELSNTD